MSGLHEGLYTIRRLTGYGKHPALGHKERPVRMDLVPELEGPPESRARYDDDQDAGTNTGRTSAIYGG